MGGDSVWLVPARRGGVRWFLTLLLTAAALLGNFPIPAALAGTGCVVKYHHYAGTTPAAPTGNDWHQPASRAWIAMVLYQALTATR
jgi:hypothetical protein